MQTLAYRIRGSENVPVPIIVNLEDVEEGLLVKHLGWDDPDYIISCQNRMENHWRWEVAFREFYIQRDDTRYFFSFTSNPLYNATLVSKIIKDIFSAVFI